MANKLARYTGGRLKMQLESTRGKLAKYKREQAAGVVPGALMTAGVTVTGGALAGAVRALQPDIMGIPTEAGAAIVAATAGATMGWPWLIHAAGGMAAAYAADFSETAIIDFRAQQSAPEVK
jgi:hypothetical protein